ncbi:MAG TPA: CRISPR-associated protein Csx15 [Anaerolineales bacterium]|nr:CRISPR-associated protein Csx15 [Anaerolineales bacterium]
MLLLNLSHPLTPDQLEAIGRLTGQPVERVIALPAQFDHQQPFGPQLEALMTRAELAPQEWQTASILVNPPSLNFITALVLAELHGRMGYFPPVVRLRPVKEALPPRYEVAEILNLQAVRDAARLKRMKAEG